MISKSTSAATRAGAQVRRRVEHCDIDAFGVVHFSRYAAFMETAVLAALEATGHGLDHVQSLGLELRVRQLKITYRAAARYNDQLILVSEVGLAGAAHLQMLARVLREEPDSEPSLLASGELDLVFVTTSTGDPGLLPASLTDLTGGRH